MELISNSSWFILVRFIEVFRRLFMHSFLKVLPQHLSQAGVWTLNGSLLQLDSFSATQNCWFAVTSLSCCMIQLWPSFRCGTDGLRFDFSNFGTQRSSWSAKSSLLHCRAWQLICCVCFSLYVVLWITVKHHYFALGCPWTLLHTSCGLFRYGFENLSCATMFFLKRRDCVLHTRSFSSCTVMNFGI